MPAQRSATIDPTCRGRAARSASPATANIIDAPSISSLVLTSYAGKEHFLRRRLRAARAPCGGEPAAGEEDGGEDGEVEHLGRSLFEARAHLVQRDEAADP